MMAVLKMTAKIWFFTTTQSKSNIFTFSLLLLVSYHTFKEEKFFDQPKTQKECRRKNIQ
jgi:hypothetical protein